MSDSKYISALESILGDEVRTNESGNHFVDLNYAGCTQSIYTPEMNEIKKLGFEVTAIRAGWENKLRVWFKHKEEGEA